MDTPYSQTMGVQDTENRAPMLFNSDDGMMFSKRSNPELVKADKLMRQYTPREAIRIIDDIQKTGNKHADIADTERVLWLLQKDADLIMSNPDKQMVQIWKSKMNIGFYTAQGSGWKTDVYNPRILSLELARRIHADALTSRAMKTTGGQNENDKQYGVLNTSINKHEITQQQTPQVKKPGLLGKLFGRG